MGKDNYKLKDNEVLWGGEWKSTIHPKVLNGLIYMPLQEPYNIQQEYDTKVNVVYKGIYKKNGISVIPIGVNCTISDKPHKEENVRMKIEGVYNNLKLEYNITVFEDNLIKGKYSCRGGGLKNDDGVFIIRPSKERTINRKEKGTDLFSYFKK